MPIKFSETSIKRRTSKATITIGDAHARRAEEIRIEFNAITPERFDAINAMEKAPDAEASPNAVIARQLAYLQVSSPDIVEDDGVTPTELTAERLLLWESTNLASLQLAVLGESLPKQRSLPTTEDTSSKTASSENDPGTQTTSTSESASA